MSGTAKKLTTHNAKMISLVSREMSLSSMDIFMICLSALSMYRSHRNFGGRKRNHSL